MHKSDLDPEKILGREVIQQLIEEWNDLMEKFFHLRVVVDESYHISLQYDEEYDDRNDYYV